MYRLCFVLALCVYGALANRIKKDLIDWQQDANVQSESSDRDDSGICKKDILLVLDTSESIGKTHFDNNVKPFLRNLVTDEELNVGETTTQIGLILFSHDDPRKTKKSLNIGEITDATRLGQYFMDLQWSTVRGHHTRTDLGLTKANEIFNEKNPLNKRPNINDVVILITDGNPHGIRNVLQETQKQVDELKKKGILIVVAAVGPEAQNFKDNLKRFASSEEYVVDGDFQNIERLIDISCRNPISCRCNKEIASGPMYIQPGESKIEVTDWAVPEFSCEHGSRPIPTSTVVQPTLPHRFSVGNHYINYTFHLEGDVTLQCPTTINVRGNMCNGVAFDSNQICCCGTIHTRQPDHECCGQQYYNRSDQLQCCANANLIPSEESCQHYNDVGNKGVPQP